MWSKAITDYHSYKEGELSFNIGDSIEVIGFTNNGWAQGRHENGEEGIFPIKHVKNIEVPLPAPNIDVDNSNAADFDDDISSMKDFPRNYPQPIAKQRKPIAKHVPKFEAKNVSMKIVEWLRLYEQSTIDDGERLENLQNYIGEKELSWYSKVILSRKVKVSWEECKNRMLNRFGGGRERKLRPIVAAFERKYGKNDTIDEYYEDKIELLNLADLKEEDQVALLTHGMPKEDQLAFESKKIETTEDWYRFAKKMECMPGNFGSKFNIDNSDDDEPERV